MREGPSRISRSSGRSSGYELRALLPGVTKPSTKSHVPEPLAINVSSHLGFTVIDVFPDIKRMTMLIGFDCSFSDTVAKLNLVGLEPG